MLSSCTISHWNFYSLHRIHVLLHNAKQLNGFKVFHFIVLDSPLSLRLTFREEEAITNNDVAIQICLKGLSQLIVSSFSSANFLSENNSRVIKSN